MLKQIFILYTFKVFNKKIIITFNKLLHINTILKKYHIKKLGKQISLTSVYISSKVLTIIIIIISLLCYLYMWWVKLGNKFVRNGDLEQYNE